MENSQVIALVAIGISLFALGLSFVVPISLQSDIRDLSDKIIKQSQTTNSLSSQLNDSAQLVKTQNSIINDLKTQQNSSQTQINNLQTNAMNLENRIDSLTNRVATLEQSRNIQQPTLTPQKPTTFVQGKIGQALRFNGIDGVVIVPNSPKLNFGNGSFSISTWVSTTSTTFGWEISHNSNNDGIHAGYEIGVGSGTVEARIGQNSTINAYVFSNAKINDGSFHHIVLVVDRSTQTMRLYVDNNLQERVSIANVGNTNTYHDLCIGGVTSPDTLVAFFDGSIDQTRIYDRTLSPQEIGELYAETSSSTVPTNGLVGEWKFDGNTLDTSG